MRNTYTITITDVHGSRQFTLSYLLKRILVWFLLLLTLMVLVGVGVLYELMRERSELESQIEDLYIQKQEIEAGLRQELDKQNELFSELSQDKVALEQEVQQKAGQLNFLQGALGKIEDRLNEVVGKELESKKLTELAPIDVELMMSKIPSGLPTTFKMITDGFGWRTHPISKKRSFHDGLDFSCDIGTSVRVTANGVVEKAGFDASGYGYVVIVNHGYGFKTVYAHLSKVLVNRGQVVARGDEIALTGNTGASSGPHLHYEVHYLGNKLNPRFFADWGLRKFDVIFKQVREVPWESFADLVILEKQLVLKQSLPTDVVSGVISR